MITIDQLLESVDLDFEPRFVTKDEDGTVSIFEKKPERCNDFYRVDGDNIGEVVMCTKLKLSEFDGKDWTECIYEVPRKEEPKIKIGTLYIDKDVTFGDGDDDDVGFAQQDYEVSRKTTVKIEKLLEQKLTIGKTKYEYPTNAMLMDKINELVDAVNELKGAKNE